MRIIIVATECCFWTIICTACRTHSNWDAVSECVCVCVCAECQLCNQIFPLPMSLVLRNIFSLAKSRLLLYFFTRACFYWGKGRRWLGSKCVTFWAYVYNCFFLLISNLLLATSPWLVAILWWPTESADFLLICVHTFVEFKLTQWLRNFVVLHWTCAKSYYRHYRHYLHTHTRKRSSNSVLIVIN